MELLDGAILVSLITLTAMEIVLGIDNIVFISILAGRLPAQQQALARRLGLGLALVSRLALLFAVSFLLGLTAPLFALFGHGFSGRDLILILGGLFLLWKATHEIHERLEVATEHAEAPKVVSFRWTIVQIIALDMVFSIDSVITAVGMVDQLFVIVIAMVIAVGTMLAFAGQVSRFIEKHPSLKILALSFLILIGVMLVAEGFGQHIGKGYIYFAMAFALAVEVLNLRLRTRHIAPVELHHRGLPVSGSVPGDSGTV